MKRTSRSRNLFSFTLTFLFFSIFSCYAQKSVKKVDMKVTSYSSEFKKLIPKNPNLEVLSQEGKWSEGPVVLSNGDVLWSDIVNNRVLKWNETEGTKVWLFPSQFHNGHCIDKEGRLLAASHGKRAIERLEKDGTWTILVDLYGDKKLNSPNDLVIDNDGEIWFTDPAFGIQKDDEGYGGNSVIGGEFVFRFNPNTKKIEKLNTKEVAIPNGIAFSNDKKILYITDSKVANTNKSINKSNLVAYEVDNNKNLRNGKIIAQFDDGVPDGLKVDEKGNIWVTSGKDIYIVSASGERIGKLSFPENVANLVFAKKGRQSVIYITGSQYLFRLNVLVGGAK